nr:IS481 family transposase [Bordetella pertussis]
MNTHKHARLTFLRRLEMVQQLIAHQVCVPEAARAYGVTAPTVRKWLGRFLAQGQAGLADASSRPTVSPRAIAPAKALAIVELRRKRLTQARIAQALGVSASTVSRVLARAGLSHLADLEPAEPVVRYEHQAPGDLLHIDIKKLGRIQRPGHRVTGNRRDTVEGAGWDFVFVAIDDHARVAFTDIHPDERFPSAVQFLKDAVAYYQRLGVTIQRLLTDNGSAFRSRAFAALCHELGIKHRFTRPYRPQTNGKAERFIQSALREWAYAHTYQNSQHRADAMKSWLHHYNWHRPHQGIGRAVPISRLNLDEYNLLTVHSYSILLMHAGFSTAPSLYKNPGYEPYTSFEPIGLVVDVPMTIIARGDFPPNNIKELAEYVKKNADKISLANAGIGAASHLCGTMLVEALGVNLLTIPYKGTAPAMNDLLGKQVDLMCDQTTNTTQQITSGKVKAYAVTSLKRVPTLPDLPTMDESGYKGFEVGIWHGMWAPKGTPKPVVDKLVKSLQAGLADPKFQERMKQLGAEVLTNEANPEALQAKVKQQVPQWAELFKKAGVEKQ